MIIFTLFIEILRQHWSSDSFGAMQYGDHRYQRAMNIVHVQFQNIAKSTTALCVKCVSSVNRCKKMDKSVKHIVSQPDRARQSLNDDTEIHYQARALRALGLLLADGTPTVGGGMTF